jgi:hypothetical protein
MFFSSHASKDITKYYRLPFVLECVATQRQRRTHFFLYCPSDATEILMRKTVERKENWEKRQQYEKMS